MDAVQKANSGHPGTPMALAPLAYTLYTRIMRHNPSDPDWIDRDRFILSAGHASMLLYSMLYLTGYPLTLEDIKNFRQVGSPTAGHPERKYSPGDRGDHRSARPGDLDGGRARARPSGCSPRASTTDGHEVVDHHTFTIASDGDIQEGVASEASSLAGHLGLGRLIAYYDDNHIQLASKVDAVMTEDVAERYEAYGWHVLDIGEDLSVGADRAATREAMAVEDRPSLIIVHSHIGYGSPQQAGHLGRPRLAARRGRGPADQGGLRLGSRQAVLRARRRRSSTSAAAASAAASSQSEWQQRFDAYREANPEQAEQLEMIDAGGMPDGWDADLPRFSPDDDPIATRKASEKAIQWAAQGGPAPDRRLGRPRQLDQHRHRRRWRRADGRLRRAQPALRRARARDGRDRQRARRCTASGRSARRS